MFTITSAAEVTSGVDLCRYHKRASRALLHASVSPGLLANVAVRVYTKQWIPVSTTRPQVTSPLTDKSQRLAPHVHPRLLTKLYPTVKRQNHGYS